MIFAIAGSGNAILFVVSMAACAAVTAYLVILASHVYMVILQGTAAGIDKVRWPDDPFFDWLIPAGYFFFLIAILLLPAGLLSRALQDQFLPDNKPLRYLILAGPIVWLFLPVGLLSSLSSASGLGVLSPRVVMGFVKHAPTVLGFYLITAVLIATAGGLGYVALFSPVWYSLPVAVVVLAAVYMIHARLIGRIGWLISHNPESRKASKAATPQPTGKAPKQRKRRVRLPDAEDPWAVPEPESPPPATAGGLGYALVEEPAEVKPPRPRCVDPDPDPYTLAHTDDVETPEEAPAPPESREHSPESSRVKREIAMRLREAPNPPPTFPLFSGVYEFPLYQDCRKPLVWLVLWGCLAGVLCRAMILFYPS